MISSNEFKAIAELDLDPIKVKIMHRESGEGWSLEKVNAVEVEYRRFLYLMKKYPNEKTAPLFDVDTFWHYHILDTLKYAADCEQVFGYFLHHFPYIGLRGEEDEAAHQEAGSRMQELYEATFGEPYLRADGPEPVPYGLTGWKGQDDGTKLVAWSGAANPAKAPGKMTAWSGVAATAAWSGAAGKASMAGTAWSGAAGKVSDFYSQRPTLAEATTA